LKVQTRTLSEELAGFVFNASYDDISGEARKQLKVRILDSIGCAIGAIKSELAMKILDQVRDFGGDGASTLIGGGRAAPDRAAFYNSALVRYLDFNDSYLAKGETCHPSDNLGAVLAASEYACGSGRDLLTALAVAYQVQCRLSDVAPVRARGFDHTTQGSFALAAGVSKALGLDHEKTTNAIAICGTAFNALRVTRTGALSNWKGLAYPNAAFCCVHATFLAMRGITGPREVFEGNKGFIDTISGRFDIDWSKEDLERVNRTIIKKYNAEIHSQSAIEAAIELRGEHGISVPEIERIEIDIFDVAYNIIGGGEEGDKTVVRTKEEADHSLQYMVAVALIDGKVMPEEYLPERIKREDVQALLKKTVVRPDENLSRVFPEEHACKVAIFLKGGRIFSKSKKDYEGFHTRPMGWDGVARKFSVLTGPHLKNGLGEKILEAVDNLENIGVQDLTYLLTQVGTK
jgi:2-methylcitrate dehydratase